MTKIEHIILLLIGAFIAAGLVTATLVLLIEQYAREEFVIEEVL